ncbi:periplasmic heavy metal sensor [Thalassococcus sp. BH17M4-6]|uniref:periplasmic heavy metal sensor n=1 Tax=Thalassococcus sp. BH17M4-6 TaxID=3413148 RepID=UPI003BDD4AA7
MADQAPRMKFWLRLVLFASLALNLVIVGIVAGFVLRGGPDHRDGPRGRDGAVRYSRALTEDQRDALRRDLRAAFRGDRRAVAAEIAGDFRAAVEVLRADPFDRAAFDAVMARQDTRAEARQQTGRQALLDVVSGMSTEERQAYADRLSDQIDRLEKRMWRRRDDD